MGVHDNTGDQVKTVRQQLLVRADRLVTLPQRRVVDNVFDLHAIRDDDKVGTVSHDDLLSESKGRVSGWGGLAVVARLAAIRALPVGSGLQHAQPISPGERGYVRLSIGACLSNANVSLFAVIYLRRFFRSSRRRCVSQ